MSITVTRFATPDPHLAADCGPDQGVATLFMTHQPPAERIGRLGALDAERSVALDDERSVALAA
jgi:hypothetical protein